MRTSTIASSRRKMGERSVADAHATGESQVVSDVMSSCTLCPRNCGADRHVRAGVCGATDTLRVARAALHFWEEPCISGKNGSGAVFFSGCALRCVFCQNGPIARQNVGKDISKERLAEIFLELAGAGANNINLVTAGHFVPQVIWAVEEARRQGMTLPVIYNTGSYEKAETLKRLEGIVDVYLPDFKFMDPVLAKNYANAGDYAQVAKAAIAEMVRQQPKLRFYPELWRETGSQTGTSSKTGNQMEALSETGNQMEALSETGNQMEALSETGNQVSMSGASENYDSENCLVRNGVIVRQLLLPGHVADAKEIVRYLYETYGNQIYISLMSQYTPVLKGIAEKKHSEDATTQADGESELARELPRGELLMQKYPELLRRVTKREYERLVNYALELGISQAFIQEREVAEESFIPDFDGKGV